MSAPDLIWLAILLPLLGAVGIVFAGRVSANLRETVTLVTAAALAYTVWSLIPDLMDGARPELSLIEVVPGLEIAFRIEPLGMLFAALASGLWIVNSVYSIGYMRGNNEKHQTRFYVFFALSLAATMIGVPPTGGFVSKWYILAGAFEADNYVAIFTIIASTVLNAAYFLPIIFAAWFGKEVIEGGKEHGEAPFAAVLALTITAALTILFFLFNGPVIELEKQLLGAVS